MEDNFNPGEIGDTTKVNIHENGTKETSVEQMRMFPGRDSFDWSD